MTAGRAVSVDEIMSSLRARRLRNRWGSWVYISSNRTLECRGAHGGYVYDVDLDLCRTSAEVYGWIVQVSKKTWATDSVLADLVHALNDLLSFSPGAMCSGGMNSTISPRELLAGRPGYEEEDR